MWQKVVTDVVEGKALLLPKGGTETIPGLSASPVGVAGTTERVGRREGDVASGARPIVFTGRGGDARGAASKSFDVY